MQQEMAVKCFENKETIHVSHKQLKQVVKVLLSPPNDFLSPMGSCNLLSTSLSLRVLWYSGIPRFLATLTFNFFLPPTQYCPVSSFSLWYFCGYSRLGVKNGTLKKIMRQSRPKYTNKSRNLSYRKKPAVSWPEFLRIWLLHMTSFFLVFLSSKSPYHTFNVP